MFRSRNCSTRRSLYYPGVLLTIVALAAGVPGCATTPELTREQAIERVDTVGALDARLTRARASGLDVLAPAGVAAAQKSLDQAIASVRDEEADEAGRLASKGLNQLERAESDSRRSSEALREVLEVRRRALAADAQTLLPERFEDLESELLKAARTAEAGDVEAAKDSEPSLRQGYAALELDALKTDATDLARAAIQAARDADARNHAPETFGRAQQELKIAMGILETDRSRLSQANVHARRASELAARSQQISELAKEFDRMDYDHEAIVLWYQRQLEEVTAPLEGGLDLTQPNHLTVADARARVAALVAEQRQTEAELAEARGRINALELASTASTADLEARLARLEAQQREAEARYARVDSMFSEEEATVYRRGQDVLLETYGFEFPVGQSEIVATNFPLLNKIARAISEFDNPKIVVTGHTDSTGNDDTNQRLSDERAQKVGAFLVEVGQLDPDYVTTKGFGESRPVASNETEPGRARNRRIEILIVNQPGAASQALEAVSAPPQE